MTVQNVRIGRFTVSHGYLCPADGKLQTRNRYFSNPFAAISQFSVSSPIFYSIVFFGVHFVTLDNYAGRSDSLGITEFSR